MLNQKADFGRYGKSFQEGLVQLIFEDRPFADQITEVLNVEFLELEYPEFEKPVIDLTTQRDIEGDNKIEKVKKFNKSNTISLGLIFSVIIILLIEIFVNQKLIFKKIKKN